MAIILSAPADGKAPPYPYPTTSWPKFQNTLLDRDAKLRHPVDAQAMYRLDTTLSKAGRLLGLLDEKNEPTKDLRRYREGTEAEGLRILRENAKRLYAPVLSLPLDASKEAFWEKFYPAIRPKASRPDNPSKASTFAVKLFDFVGIDVSPEWRGAPRAWWPERAGSVDEQLNTSAFKDRLARWEIAMEVIRDFAFPDTTSEEIRDFIRAMTSFTPSSAGATAVSDQDRATVLKVAQRILDWLGKP